MNKPTTRDLFFFMSGMNLTCFMFGLTDTDINYIILMLNLIATIFCFIMGLRE